MDQTRTKVRTIGIEERLDDLDYELRNINKGKSGISETARENCSRLSTGNLLFNKEIEDSSI